jgi:hypothetical protein
MVRNMGKSETLRAIVAIAIVANSIAVLAMSLHPIAVALAVAGIVGAIALAATVVIDVRQDRRMARMCLSR